MRLATEFLRLPIRFDAAILREEVESLPESAWRPHPQGFAGNAGLPLVAAHGDPGNERTWGPMLPTPQLDALPRIRHVLAALDCPIGRSRLMRIDGNAEATSHTDLDYYWQGRLRVHVPIVTTDAVRFECGSAAVHMRAGEVWVFDTTQAHRVLNPESSRRIHLVIDTVGSAALFALLEDARNAVPDRAAPAWPPDADRPIAFEHVNRPLVMSPFEQRELLRELLSMFAEAWPARRLQAIERSLAPVLQDWTAAWARYGIGADGLASYRALRDRLRETLRTVAEADRFRGSGVFDWLDRWLAVPAIDEDAFAAQERAPAPTAQAATVSAETQSAFASQYTDSMPALLRALGGSLLVSTYASNRLVSIRARGDELNTHFKHYPAPMGIAYADGMLALGAAYSVWTFRNQPEVATDASTDAVFVPTGHHITGDIRVHELAWGTDGLWLVNTRFSCLAMLDAAHSFVPRWSPAFVERSSEEDACHLNGVAIHDGAPRWVSALGRSGTASGWRANKASGGIVIDVRDDAIVSAGLCMPHSPRWHDGQLWVLDSGRGELCQVNLESGRRDSVARLPGFARGLAMVGKFAFVGCSRVRESAWFSGLPVVEQGRIPECGIWAVDLDSGQIVGWLKFEAGIDEIFDVQWLPGLAWPDVLEVDEPTALNAFAVPADTLQRFV